MIMIALLIGLLAAPALFCAISGLVRFPLKVRDRDVIAQKRWKYARMASRILVVSWIVYGMAAWSYLPRILSPQVDRTAAAILHAGELIYFVHFLYANLLGLLSFLPVALGYLLYLLAFSWSDRRIRQEDFPLAGAVRLMLFEGTRTLLPYALLILFVLSGVMPLIAVRRTILHFNWLIAFVMVASCTLVYFKSFAIAKRIMKTVVPLREAALEQRVSEMATAAGVKAGKLFRLRTFGYPYAQGYALINRDICLSDLVLDGFDPTERDAVIAHELGHFKHLTPLVVKRFAVYLVLVFGLSFLFPFSDAFFFENALGIVVKFALIYGWLLLMIRLNKSSRRYELDADKFSASVVGNEVFVKAMEKLHEVNFLPRRFNEKGKEKMTHPSLDMRISAVAQSGTLPTEPREAKENEAGSGSETGSSGRFSMKKKVVMIGAALIIFVVGFLSGAVWMSTKFANSMSVGSLGPDTEEMSSFNSGDQLWAYQFYGGMYKDEERLKRVPEGKGVLQIKLTHDGTPAAGVRCKLFLNGKFKTGKQATNAGGVLTFTLPERDWYINAIQCSRWTNKPDGDFMLVAPGLRSLKINEGEYIPDFGELGKKVTVSAKAPDQPQVSLLLNRRVMLLWPKKTGRKQEASLAKTKIRWEPYPKAATYLVRVQHVTREGTMSTFMPILRKKVTGTTSLPLSQLAHTRDATAKEEYAVTIEAYGPNGDFLGESQSFDGTFTLTDGNVLVEDKHGIYASADQDTLNRVYRETKILESAESMINEKMYGQAETMLSRVTENGLQGKKYLMMGYLFASRNDCKKAKVLFDKAQTKGVDCVPEEYRGKCK